VSHPGEAPRSGSPPLKLFAAHNAAWNESLDMENPPMRACVQAARWIPERRAEMVSAALSRAAEPLTT
jgi:enamine deaminase RidA (YjgF/YER057c/UK114 family)